MTPDPTPGRGTPGKRLRVCDFLRRSGITLDSPEDGISPEDTLIAGDLLNQELRRGLHLHGGNVIEEHAFTATSNLPAGLSCVFFLDGQVAVSIGDRRFEFHGDRRGTIAAAAVMSVTPESFRRMSTGRQHVQHLVISATPEWLNVDGLEEARSDPLANRLFRDHLADHRWTPTPRVSELVRGIFAPSGFGPELDALRLEGRAVAIVAETIAAVMHADRTAETRGLLLGRERACLRRAKDLIGADPGRPLRVELIAREAGISASGLQRLFRVAEGCSVFEYVRLARLERARVALQSGEAGVQDASMIAGYSSPANFATAFKRRYGVTPREASRRS
jgi:AraC-like DNA-binding protein